MLRFCRSSVAAMLLFFTVAVHAHEPPDGLLLQLPFDGSLAAGGTTGASAELIASGGEPAASEPEYRQGRFGQAIYLSGETAVRVPLDLSYEFYPRVTVTAWVYPEGESHGYIFSNRSRSGPTLSVGGSSVSARGPGAQPGEGGMLRPGRWTFIAGVWNTEAGTMRLHYGRRSETVELGDRIEAAALDVWIGAWDDSLLAQVENIRIDDVRVYGEALTPEQLEGLWLGQPVEGLDGTPSSAAATQTTPAERMTGSDAETVRKKPGRTTSDAVPDGEQLDTSIKAQEPLVSGLSQDTPAGELTSDLERMRQTTGPVSSRTDEDGGTSALGGDLPSASELRQSAGEQTEPVTTGGIQSGGTELERMLEEGRSEGSSATSGTADAGGESDASPTVEQLLQVTDFDVTPSGDVTACGGFGTIFNPLWRENRDNLLILGRGCATLYDKVDSLARDISEQSFQTDTPCDNAEQLRQRLRDAVEKDGDGALDEEKLRGLECAAGLLFTNVINKCIAVSQTPVNLVESVIGWYNNWLTNDGPASLGPRAIDMGTNTGTVLAPGNRRWFTPTVRQTDSATVAIRRDGGNARVIARVCTVNSMNEFRFVDEITFDGDSPDLSLTTLDNVDGHFITVFMQTKGGPTNTGRRMSYSLEVTD